MTSLSCFTLRVLLLSFVSRLVILDLQLLGSHQRVEMQFAQLVLLDEGFESDSETGTVSEKTRGNHQRHKLTAPPFPCRQSLSWECPSLPGSPRVCPKG